MIREWLPHLIVGLLALTAGSFGTWLLSSSDNEWKDHEKDWLGGMSSGDGNSTLEYRLPPRPLVSWASFGFTVIGGFYFAAAISGWIHRSEDS